MTISQAPAVRGGRAAAPGGQCRAAVYDYIFYRGVRADIYIFLENVATLVPQALERERERVILVNVIEPRGRFGSQVDFGEKNAYLLCQVAESRNKS